VETTNVLRSQGLEYPLDGQVAIVTGAGRGLGREIAVALAAAGASVVLAARTPEQLAEVASVVAEQGGTALSVPTDVSDRAAVASLVKATMEKFGRIDILVNNAASANYVSALALSDDERWMRMFDVNVFGVYLCTKAVIPHMMRAKSGRVINVSSIAGKAGAAFNTAYSASKAAVIGFTKALALEVAKAGITSNAICPWHVDTELMRDAMAARGTMFGGTVDDYIAKIAATNPQRRLITAQEIAGLALFLCLPASRGINGQAINQCGGMVKA
jgi:NAD(P)-dependent dehydrogenase (short-subunit alcohol dehydrogenase family)